MNIFTFSSCLTIIFVISKIMNYIDWSWWGVFSPTLIYFLISLLPLIFYVFVAVSGCAIVGGIFILELIKALWTGVSKNGKYLR